MSRYYRRLCNLYYGNSSKKLVNKNKTIPLNGIKEISFENLLFIYSLIRYLEISIAAVAPNDDAKDISIMALYKSNINPDSRPSISATGIDSVVRTTYTIKYANIKKIGFCI